MNRISSESVNLISQPRHNKSFKKKGKKSKGNHSLDKGIGPSQKALGPKPDIKKGELRCWFCKSVGHKKSNCQAFKSFTEAQKAKGQSLAFICFESSLIDVPVNS